MASLSAAAVSATARSAMTASTRAAAAPLAVSVPAPDLTLLFDAHCPMCMTERRLFESIDFQQRIRWVDISDREPKYGVSYQTLMSGFHAVRNDNTVLVGMDAFRAAYATIGLGYVLGWTGRPLLRPLFNLLYAVFARVRVPLGNVINAVLPGDSAPPACPGDSCDLRPRLPVPSERGAVHTLVSLLAALSLPVAATLPPCPTSSPPTRLVLFDARSWLSTRLMRIVRSFDLAAHGAGNQRLEFVDHSADRAAGALPSLHPAAAAALARVRTQAHLPADSFVVVDVQIAAPEQPSPSGILGVWSGWTALHEAMSEATATPPSTTRTTVALLTVLAWIAVCYSLVASVLGTVRKR